MIQYQRTAPAKSGEVYLQTHQESLSARQHAWVIRRRVYGHPSHPAKQGAGQPATHRKGSEQFDAVRQFRGS